jgi:hypothetical protein
MQPRKVTLYDDPVRDAVACHRVLDIARVVALVLLAHVRNVKLRVGEEAPLLQPALLPGIDFMKPFRPEFMGKNSKSVNYKFLNFSAIGPKNFAQNGQILFCL